MKSVYVVCALLCVTIGTLVLADDNAKGSNNGTQLTDDKGATTAVPHNKSDPTPSTTSTSTATTASSTTTSTSSTASTPTTLSTTTATPPSTHSKSTESPPTTTTSKSNSTTTNSTPTTPHSSTAGPGTTAVPAPSPSKDRHFDGLSFFGGIILATCLMAIAVFAWKFYRQCNEGNYRTL